MKNKLNNIYRFNDDDKKRICIYIAKYSSKKDTIDCLCREVHTFIKYDYDYYLEFELEITNKNIKSQWNNEILTQLNKDVRFINFTFKDFAKKMPKNKKLDNQAIINFLDNYSEQKTEDIIISKKEAFEICKKLNYILTINSINLIKIMYDFDNMYNFTEEELTEFLDKYFFNYPYVAENFYNNLKEKSNSKFEKYLKNKIDIFKKEQKDKYGISLFIPSNDRIIAYRKQQLKKNHKINDESKKYSVLYNVFQTQTILYSNKTGYILKKGKKDEIVVNEMQLIEHKYSIPLENIIDPITYLYEHKKIE